MTITRLLTLLILMSLVVMRCKEPPPATEKAYTEKYRPQFHFTPKARWMNDPNGMVYHEGEYHLFYQYYPDGDVWGPMHWGHAVTTDLVLWEHLPIALYPDSLGMIFSGSAVVDKENSSGFGTDDNPPLIAIFTYHDAAREKQGKNDFQTQGIAYSLDKGRSWTKYDGNPVITNPGVRDFRDPKVFWHEDSKQWIMILVAADHAELYGSANLKSWTKLSEFGKEYGNHGGVWECPDLFQLPVEGEGIQKWIMIVNINPGAPNRGSGTQYFVGEFDGKKFTCDTEKTKTSWLDYGPDDYAGITWSNAPDGRKIFIGWMNNWSYAQVVPTAPWRGGTTVARDLSLVRIDGSLYVKSVIVEEMEKLIAEAKEFRRIVVRDSVNLTDSISFPITTSILSGSMETRDFVVEFSNEKGQRIEIGYRAASKQYFIDRSNSGNINFSKDFSVPIVAPRLASGEKINFTMALDVSSVEIFFDDGVTVMASLFFPDQEYTRLKIRSDSGSVRIDTLRVKRLVSIW